MGLLTERRAGLVILVIVILLVTGQLQASGDAPANKNLRYDTILLTCTPPK